MSDSADRELAARLLIRIEDGAYSSRLLAGRMPAGVRARVLGVLRWLRPLDAVLAGLSRRPLERLDPEVRATLRLGLHDAAQLEVPAAVATDAAVRLVRRLGKGSASGLVNAVLRRGTPAWTRLLETAPPDLRLSHPEWLALRWRRHFGDEAAICAMEADQQPAPVWVWWLREQARVETSHRVDDLEPHPWCPGAWSSAARPGDVLAAVVAGDAYVQDPSSQLVSHVARAIAGEGARMADVCAAPGGKLALWRRLGGGPALTAMDRRLGRVRLVGELMGRIGNAGLIVGDAALPPLPAASFDLVLADAPCSGTGTLRRHPELRWRLAPESIEEMAAVQRRILAGAFDLVSSGGVLLYTTCSVEPEENEGLLSPTPTGFQRVELEGWLPPGVPWIATSAGGIRILPHEHGDGFTMHAVKRIADSAQRIADSGQCRPPTRRMR